MTTTSTSSDFKINILLSDALYDETQKVVWMLRHEPHNPQSGIKAVELLREATEVNLAFYFTEPAKRLKLGVVGVKLLVAGANTVLKLISSLGHRLVKKLSEEQLSLIADFVEAELLSHGHAKQQQSHSHFAEATSETKI